MKVERDQAALITGGGIGRSLAVALAKRGVQVSVLDLASAQGEETVRAITDEHARISYKPTTPSVIFIQCDVSKTAGLTAAFAQHQSVFERLDIHSLQILSEAHSSLCFPTDAFAVGALTLRLLICRHR
jgi:NAD(P)-dependent dehydrogenase (short-subunit alcohol dehydrogenase family)